MGCTQDRQLRLAKTPSGVRKDAEGQPPKAESFQVSGRYGGQRSDIGVHQGIEAHLGEVRRALRVLGRDRSVEDNRQGASGVHAEVSRHERELSGVSVRLSQAVPEVLGASSGVQVEMADSGQAKTSLMALSGGSREGSHVQDGSERGVLGGDGNPSRCETSGDSKAHSEGLEGRTLDGTGKALGKEQAAVRLGSSGLEARVRDDAQDDGQGRHRADLGSVGALLRLRSSKIQCSDRRESPKPQVPEDIRNLGTGCWGAIGGPSYAVRTFLAKRYRTLPGLEPSSDEGSDRAIAHTITVEASRDINIDNCSAPSGYWIRLPTYARPLDRFKLSRFSPGSKEVV